MNQEQKQNQSRRAFLGKALSTTLGGILLSQTPSWARRSLHHGRVYRERSFFTMGSVASICAYGEDTRQIDLAVNRVQHEFRRLESLLSVFNPASDVSRVNASAGKETVAVDPVLISLVSTSMDFSGMTGGAFDITVEPLMRRWGFRTEQREVQAFPTDRELTDLIGAVGYHNISMEPERCRVGLSHPLSAIDLGGIAVGYAVDQAVSILKHHGIEAAFINHSGDAYALGSPEEGEGWEIGIPDPIHPREIIERFQIKDRGVATSGNYEQYVTFEGRRFGHILDPRSGKPCSRVLSATVLAPTVLAADGLSTAWFCTERTEETHLENEVQVISILDNNGTASVQRS